MKITTNQKENLPPLQKDSPKSAIIKSKMLQILIIKNLAKSLRFVSSAWSLVNFKLFSLIKIMYKKIKPDYFIAVHLLPSQYNNNSRVCSVNCIVLLYKLS